MGDSAGSIYSEFKSQMLELGEFDTDLQFRQKFKVLYSAITKAPVMVLGYNPCTYDLVYPGM